MRIGSMPRGLMVIGIVLAAAAAVSASEESAKPGAGECAICSMQASCPAMQAGAKIESCNIQNGVAMLILVSDPAKVAEFHQGWDQCKAEMDKVMKWSKAEAQSHLCAMCQGYYNLTKEGAQWECIKTETGLLSLLTAKKPKLVAAIQKQAAAQKELMAQKAACTGSQPPGSTVDKDAEKEKEGVSNSP